VVKVQPVFSEEGAFVFCVAGAAWAVEEWALFTEGPSSTNLLHYDNTVHTISNIMYVFF
jgi:hypothetical protein